MVAGRTHLYVAAEPLLTRTAAAGLQLTAGPLVHWSSGRAREV